ncbi:unnamed protein product [Urochloa decumbens]|uniref:Protein FAR1-RELATED SEQUENCE n=1 Tax=Urochloa decumbens TaxID=240449 RepID=A0ABC9BRL5_9POAL
MDLNELPPEFDSDFLDDSSGNPFYCTQPILEYSVSTAGQQGGSQQEQFAVTFSEQFGSLQGQDHVTNDIGASDQVAIGAREQFAVGDSEHFDVGVNEHVEMRNAQVDVNNETATSQGISVSGFEAHGGDENVVGDITIEDADEIDDEIWSTPPIPYTGQTFDNKKEARQFYNMYAKRIGFSIRTGTTRLTAITREQRKVTYVCNKEGRGRKAKEDKANDESDEDESIEEISEQEDNNDGAGKKMKKLDGGKKRKREKMQHTNCKAKLVLNLIGERWQVTDFISEHNHDLILKPSLKKFLRSHKGIPQAEKEFIILLHGCNLTTGRIMQLMNEFYGSAQVVPYVGKDVSNFRSTIRRREKYKDMQETLDYFIELEGEDPEFFYKVKLDDRNRVESLFWVDGAARHAYIESYHDCVSFDATYMTNMYDMPCAPFIGINAHGQTFQLGCAFIRDEKTPSYKWLFETFLMAMKGKAPLNIITDQDGAMRNAIASVFPNANHRNCRWHIMDKFSSTIGPILDEDEELNEDFKECVNHTVTPTEFEEKWAAMLSKHHLEGNVHFQRLYAIKSSFVPAYYMHCFFPFLQSTQRSEGFNAVLKKYVNPNMSILHFVRQYQKIQEKCLVAEEGQDFKTDDRERRRWSKYPIERHAAGVYTKNLFYRFSKEFEKTAEYDVKPAGEFQYLLVPNNTTVYGYGKREYLVTAIEGDNSYFCKCSKFDRDAILCCHIMKIMTRFGVKTIPDRYVLRRWTQKAVEDTEKCASNAHLQADLIARGMPLNNRKTLWFSVLSISFAELAAEGCLSNGRYTIMQRHIKEMRSEISAIKERKKAKRQKTSNTPALDQATIGDGQLTMPSIANAAAATASGDNGVPPSIATNAGSMAAVGNPPRSNAKGRKKEKRLKKGMNAEPKRKNKCRLCKSTEHNAARCPMKEDERGLDLGSVTAQ